MNDLLNIFFVTLLVAVTLLSRIMLKSWLQPAAFFNLIWLTLVLLAVITMPNDFVSFSAIAYIFAVCSFIFIGNYIVHVSVSAKVIDALPLKADYNEAKSRKFLLIVFIALFPINFSLPFLTLFDAGFGLDTFSSFESLVKVAVFFSIGRYSGTYVEPWYWAVLLPFFYLAPLIGGHIISYYRLRTRVVIIILTFLPPLLLLAILTQRGVIGFTIYFFIASYFSTLVYRNLNRIFTVKAIIGIIASVSIVVGLLFISSLARVGATDFSQLSEISGKVFSITSSSVIVFSYWFEQMNFAFPTFGLASFAGIASVLGVKERELGLYTTFVDLSVGETSNLYSVLRPIIEDTTVLGSLIVYLLMGLFFGFFYKKLQTKANSIHFIMIVSFYAFTIMGYITSLFTYNSLTLSLVLFYLLLFASEKKYQVRSGKII